MTPDSERRQRARWSLQQVLWSIWPALPSTWAEVPARLRPAATQIARLTVAAVVAYLVADAFSPGILDLTAPLTALLVVQASTVGTLLMGVVRVGAVLTGVLVAVAFSSWFGLTWWSLAAVISVSLILAMVLRLGQQSLETAISAMLILAVSTPDLAAEVRVGNTLIGTVVGIAFSLLVPVVIPNARASEAVRRVARSQSALMGEIASTLGDRPPHPDEVTAWLDWTEHIDTEIAEAAHAVETVRESRRLNPRALTVATIHPGLLASLRRLDGCLSAERALVVAIGKELQAGSDAGPHRAASDLRRAFAVVLDDVAGGLRSFGEIVESEYGRGNPERADDALERTLETVRETRAVLTELMFLEVDPRERGDLWILQGSVLAAIDHVVSQLDLEHPERSTPAWLNRSGLPALRSAARPLAGARRWLRRVSRGRRSS